MSAMQEVSASNAPSGVLPQVTRERSVPAPKFLEVDRLGAAAIYSGAKDQLTHQELRNLDTILQVANQQIRATGSINVVVR